MVCAMGTLAPGASVTVTFALRLTLAGTLTNTASVESTMTADPNPANTATATTTVSPSSAPPPTICHSSYPSVCIPPPPPDLDCAQIPYRNFPVIYTVPNPDPHNFDSDRDGIGCES
jgi:hypothetical protein